MSVTDAAFRVALLPIIGVNIVLSGDNAVVIALRARSLPPKQIDEVVAALDLIADEHARANKTLQMLQLEAKKQVVA